MDHNAHPQRSSGAAPALSFGAVADTYDRARPGYPREAVEWLVGKRTSTVVELGAGTGKLTDVLLALGHDVLATDPLEEMLQHLLARHPDVRSAAAPAEQIPAATRSVDTVVAAQAFHWFDVAAARREFARILVPDGSLALVWNSRRTGTTPFLRAYEALLLEYGTDYREVNHRQFDAGRVAPMFDRGAFAQRALENAQALDLEGLVGRVASSSYVPAPGAPGYDDMCAALARIFAQHAADGQVVIEYDTEVYVGRVNRGTDALAP